MVIENKLIKDACIFGLDFYFYYGMDCEYLADLAGSFGSGCIGSRLVMAYD